MSLTAVSLALCDNHMPGQRRGPPSNSRSIPSAWTSGTFDFDEVDLGVAYVPDPDSKAFLRALTHEDFKRDMYLSNVTRRCHQDELERRLSEVLHRYPFKRKGEEALNFQVKMPRPPNKEDDGEDASVEDWAFHQGLAYLTLPSPLYTKQFLERYGAGGRYRLRLHGKQIHVELSYRYSARGLVELLRRTPWISPKERKRQAREEEKVTASLDLNSISFGRLDYDGVFYEGHKVQVPYLWVALNIQKDTLLVSADSLPCVMSMDCKSVISMIYAQEESRHHSDTDSSLEQRKITINKKSKPQKLAIGTKSIKQPLSTAKMENEQNRSTSLAVIFCCEHNVAFELKTDVNDEKRKLRHRIMGFDEKHEKMANMTSAHIRLVFANITAYQSFQRYVAKTSLPYDFVLPHLIEPTLMFHPLNKKSERRHLQDWQRALALDQVTLPIAFQLEKLLTNAILLPKHLVKFKDLIETISKSDADLAAEILQQIGEEVVSSFVPSWRRGAFQQLDTQILFDRARKRGEMAAKALPRLIRTWHTTVTPTSVVLKGPFFESGNRMLREYPHQLMRVSFKDENSRDLRWSFEVDVEEYLDRRVRSCFQEGIKVCGLQFERLHYSQSGLKNRTAWYITSVDPDVVRRSIGTFEKVYTKRAKLGARVAQAFSSTRPSIILDENQINLIEDVERPIDLEDTSKGMYCFTDGVGKISRSMMERLHVANHGSIEAAKRPVPAAVQFRLGGSKGVLTLDPTLEEDLICLRPSQVKFESTSRMLEVCESGFDLIKPGQLYLNRPLIQILEDRGVHWTKFMELQDHARKEISKIKHSLTRAARMMEHYDMAKEFDIPFIFRMFYHFRHSVVPSLDVSKDLETVCAEYEELGSFAMRVASIVERHILRLMKFRARIYLEGGISAIGVADEWDFLKAGQVFLARTAQDNSIHFLRGKVAICKAPSIHPGDIQVAEAIGCPPEGMEFLNDVRDVLVFSVWGSRPLPNCLSGSDLDGDIYSIITNPDFFPQEPYPPAEYPTVEAHDLGRKCTQQDLIDFQLEFYQKDILGVIANRHLVIADQAHRLGTKHGKCLTLAQMHSTAVDYQKSGNVPAQRLPPLFDQIRPDFSAEENMSAEEVDKKFYKSSKALGRLYRAITLERFELDEMQTIEDADILERKVDTSRRRTLDDDLCRRISQKYPGIELPCEISPDTPQAEVLLFFSIEIRRICHDHSLSRRQEPLSEAEVVAGVILAPSALHRERVEQTDHLRSHVESLLARTHEMLSPAGMDAPTKLARLWIAYHLGQEGARKSQFGSKSFCFVVLKCIMDLLR